MVEYQGVPDSNKTSMIIYTVLRKAFLYNSLTLVSAPTTLPSWYHVLKIFSCNHTLVTQQCALAACAISVSGLQFSGLKID